MVFKKNSATDIDYYWRKNGGNLSTKTTLKNDIPNSAATAQMIAQFSVSNDGVADDVIWNVLSASYER